MPKADATTEAHGHPSRSLVYGAAFLTASAIFAGWYFFLPHRVPASTTNELSASSQAFKAETEEIIDKTKANQAALKEQEAQWRVEEEARQAQEEARQADIDASRQELEAQGFRTTPAPTSASDDTN